MAGVVNAQNAHGAAGTKVFAIPIAGFGSRSDLVCGGGTHAATLAVLKDSSVRVDRLVPADRSALVVAVLAAAIPAASGSTDAAT